MIDKEIRSGEAATVQKQADDALRNAAWRLESIIEGTHVGTWEWNVQTGETVYNEVWAQIIGYTLDELAPISIKTFETFVHPDDLKQSDELLDRHFAGELPYYDYDCRMKHKDGHWVWVHDRGRVITRTSDGKPLMMFGTHTDITGRKQAEEALKAAEETYRNMFLNAQTGLFRTDIATGLILDANDCVARFIGYKDREELLAKPFNIAERYVDSRDRERMLSLLKQQGQFNNFEARFKRNDGSIMWMRFAGRIVPEKGWIEGVSEDITKEKTAVDALRESEENFQHSLDDSPLGVRIVTAEGETIYANRAILDIYGFGSLEELRATPVKNRYTPESYIEFKKRYERRRQGKDSPSEYEVNVVRKDGEIRHLLVSRKAQLWNGQKQYQLLYRDITEHKQEEEALASSLSLLMATMESTADGVLVVDLDKRITLWNHKFTDMWQIPEEIMSSHADELALNYVLQQMAQPEEFLAKVRELYGQPEASSNDQLNLADGRVFERYSQPQKIGDNVVGRVWFFSDITERKRAEEKLRVAQLQWSQFLEASPDPMWIKDTSGRYVAANKTYYRMEPSANGDIVGKTDADCFPPEKAAVYVADDRIAIEKGVSEGEFTAVDVDGKFHSFLTKKVVLRGPDGSVAGTLGISRDITDRKRAEDGTRRERSYFDRLVETAREGIAINDPQGKVLRVNAEFVRMFGYGADEAVGQCIDDLVAPPTRQEEARAITRSAGQGKESLLETVRRRKDGTLVDVSLISAPILVAGKLEAVYAIYRDITERKQAEAQLRQSQKMEAIGELAGGVAHDFNNLLTGILGNIALMRSNLPPADPLLENLDAAETAARQAADLTKGLLTFSRSAMVLPEPLNITAALDATMAILKQSLPATIEIVRDDEQMAWNVLLDQSQMTQILLNLAVNARDAMKGKGTLTIRTRNVTVDTVYVNEHPYARTGEFVHLSVTDTGPGMSSEVMQHLFEPFYTTKPVGSGTGLGLSIVYGAVKQAGGWITAVSAEGSGTTFDIYLPRCLEEPMQSVTPSPLSVDVRGGTVLVVEDEPVVCTVAQALLSRSGYTVLTAPDGASALDVLQEHPTGIGLVLLDMTMPGMTTGEIVQAIRALDPTVPILLNSGYTSNDAVRRMLEEGSVQGFLGKPYDLHQLLGKVQRLLHTS